MPTARGSRASAARPRASGRSRLALDAEVVVELDEAVYVVAGEHAERSVPVQQRDDLQARIAREHRAADVVATAAEAVVHVHLHVHTIAGLERCGLGPGLGGG